MSGIDSTEDDSLTPYDELLRRGGMGGSPDATPEAALRIPSPSAQDKTPPLTLRGISPQATTGTTDTSPLTARRTRDEAALTDAQQKGSGISRLPGYARIPLRVLEGISSAVSAPITSMIPGTTLHHNLELGRLRGNVSQDVNEQKKEAETANESAEAQARLNPVAKAGLTPEEVTIHDLLTGNNGQPRINPQTKAPYTYLEAFTSVKQAAQDTKPDKDENEFAVWRQQNPQAPLSEWFALKNSAKPETGTQEDQKYEQILMKGKAASTEEHAFARAYERRKTLTPIVSNTLAQPNKDTARMDKSYQLNQGRLDKARGPVDQAAARFSRLQDTLRAGTPQADALVAPELLTIMAGGAGSGLRMNEAEISRIVGGRSVWEGLRARMQRWSTNPEEANSITADQRKQIHDLVDAVGAKITAKQKILEESEGALLDADSVESHRKVLADAQNKLNSIDAGSEQQAAAGGGKTVKVQIPGHPPGQISADKLADFQKKYPNAQVLQ